MNKTALESYYQECMKEWEADAVAQQLPLHDFFLKNACELLDTQGYGLADFRPGYHIIETNAGNAYPVIDGYCFDESENMLTLVLCDFSHSETLVNQTKKEYETQIKRIERFYNDVKAGKYHNIDPSREIYSLIRLIEGDINTSPKFEESTGTLNLHIITNKLAKTLPLEEKHLPSGGNIIYRISDFEAISETKPQPLVIDFSQYKDKAYQNGLPFLPAEASPQSDFYKAYLLVLPAEVLVKSYDVFRARLLENNVRVYLQKKGKINKGIHETIKKEPHVFFIYNNGLALTAEKVIISDDGHRIEQIHGLQVVNGGQTMACLHHAWREGADVSAISLQAKLTVVSSKITQVIVPYISKYSNSQNAIKDTDQHSNDIVQIQLEKHSTKIKTPGAIPTTWFYERLRGQYANAQLHLTPSEVKDFQRKNPKKQLVHPTEFAQAIMSFEMMPYLVARGGQKVYSGVGNIKGFSDYMAALFSVNPGYILSETWYKESMGKFILNQNARQIIREVISKYNSQFSSYTASITTYTIASLVHILSEKSLSINYLQVWERQSIDKRTADNICAIARRVLSIISKRVDHGEWLKKTGAWDEIKQIMTDAQLPINSEGIFYLSRKPTLITELAKIREDFDNLTIDQKRVMIACSDEYWASLNTWIKHAHFNLSPAQERILNKRLLNHKLTDKQSRDLWNAISDAKRNGWNEPYPPEHPIEYKRMKPPLIRENPIIQFFESNEYDVLVLNRTCDMKGGSIHLEELFRRTPEIQEVEKNQMISGEAELGSTLSFDVGNCKKVVFIYTKKTDTSAIYIPIVEVCLQTVANEFNQKKILMTYIGCEGNTAIDRLQQPDIRNCIEKTLYNQSITIATQP